MNTRITITGMDGEPLSEWERDGEGNLVLGPPDLGLRHFQEVSRLRAVEWHGDKPWSLSDWMTALAGEMGEAANVIKKLNRHRDGIASVGDPSAEELQDELAIELADTLAYLVLVADAAGIDLASATVEKFNRVSEREGWDHHRLSPLEQP